MRLRSVVDGKQVKNPVLFNWSEVGTEKARLSWCWKSQFKRVGRIVREIRLFKFRDVNTILYASTEEVADAKLPGKATK